MLAEVHSVADQNRRWAVLLTSLAIVAMALLAAGLSNLELAPGRPAAHLQQPAEIDTEQGRALGQGLLDVIVVVLGILSVLLLALFAVYSFFSAEAKKRLLITLALLACLLVLYWVSEANPQQPEQAQQAPVPTAPTSLPATALPPGTAPPTVELDLHPPGWLVWLGATVLALLAAGVAASIAWLVWSQVQREPTPLEQLAEKAEWALSALEAGADLDDTIIRCYFEMSQILKQQRGIVRREAMTPREFERGLRGTGLPEEAVAQLTRLFEKVRYGSGIPDEREEHQAMTSLAAIAAACRSAS
jgi:hypothetical protein